MLTLLGAISLRGVVAAMTIESATDGDVFLVYLEPLLCPKLHAGDLVVMDNLSAHKVPGVRELIEASGAELLYLPPYSPDFNPIEKAWAKLKQLLRAAKARTTEALEQALAKALATLTGIWTSPMIAWVIEQEFGVHYHPGHVRRMLHALDFSVQRPRRILARADVAEQDRWHRHTYPNLKKNPKRKTAP